MGESPTVFGDGANTRDFVHASDVASAILSFLNAGTLQHQEHVFNVATGKETSLLDLVQTLNDILLEKGALQQPVAPVFKPNRDGDVSKSCASIERITNAIDWAPTIEFQDGLREMIEFTLSKRQVE